MKLLFVAIFLSLFEYFYFQNLLCTEEFCKTYLEKEVCRELPLGCTIQNGTHNGIFLPSPRPCNCCKYCLENLDEGHECSIGDPSSPTPNAVCGPSLYCKPDPDPDAKPTCQPMDNTNPEWPCSNHLWKYKESNLNGKLGHLEPKPECNRNGLYEPYICVPGEICFCISEKKERIFGEVPFTSLSQYALNCKCSRSYHQGREINDRSLHVPEYFRCESNGDYDKIQCIDDQCFCVNPEDGHPTHPEMELVNATLLSYDTLPCFNNNTHTEGEYYRECEDHYYKILKVVREYEEEGFEGLGYDLPNCQQDGRYGPVQKKGQKKYCADPSGKHLENFEAEKKDPKNKLYSNMDCKCARTRSIMAGKEKPECCSNGNYNAVQCRRGSCRCVDENGVQIGTEVEYRKRQDLECFNEQCIDLFI